MDAPSPTSKHSSHNNFSAPNLTSILESNVENRTGTADNSVRSYSPEGIDTSSHVANSADHSNSESEYFIIRDLTIIDVFYLNINRMIGIGIFTTPGIVWELTGSKSLSIGLWALGGCWAMLCICIYTEYAKHIPWNGGEIKYLDRVYQNPLLLFPVIVSGLFLIFSTSVDNPLAFAKYILLAANPEKNNDKQLDRLLIIFTAIIALTSICLLQFFSRRTSLALNAYFAIYKIGLLVAMTLAGYITYGRYDAERRSQYSGLHQGRGWTSWQNGRAPSFQDAMGAIALVLVSYQGWNSGFYVAGEVGGTKHLPLRHGRTLKLGSMLSVITVTILYGLATLAYSFVCEYEALANNDFGIMLFFFPRAFNRNRGKGWLVLWRLLIALSSLGNILATIYTFSRVVQQIGRQGLMMMSKFLGKTNKYYGTPEGGLIIHWTLSLCFIILAATDVLPNAHLFLSGCYSYEQLLIIFFLAIGLRRLRHEMQDFQTISAPEVVASYDDSYGEVDEVDGWHPELLTSRLLEYMVVVLASGISVVLMIGIALGFRSPPGWYWVIALALFSCTSIIYWAVLFLLIMYTLAIEPSKGPWKSESGKWLIKVKVVHKQDLEFYPPRHPIHEKFQELARTGNQRLIVNELNSDSSWYHYFIRVPRAFILRLRGNYRHYAR